MSETGEMGLTGGLSAAGRNGFNGYNGFSEFATESYKLRKSCSRVQLAASANLSQDKSPLSLPLTHSPSLSNPLHTQPGFIR